MAIDEPNARANFQLELLDMQSNATWNYHFQVNSNLK